MDPKIPEPFDSALKKGRPGEVADAEASSAESLYGRALARIQVGRDRDARSDLEKAEPELGDRCVIERVYLDTRERRDLSRALTMGREVLERAPEASALKARAQHIVGLIEGKLRHTEESAHALLEASDLYRQLGDRAGRAQVQDTLGTLHASQGRIDLALSAYVISLVEKTMLGDRYGTAITLGSLGRVHLRTGRYLDALDCFELNDRIASELGDLRGRGRILNDMGRAHIGLKDFVSARDALERCLELARRERFRDLEFFAHKDLATVSLATGKFDECNRQLKRARRAIGGKGEPYLALLLDSVAAELRVQRGDEGGLGQLEKVARQFAASDIPDYEIPLWITLARTYADRKHKQAALQCLEWAQSRARRDGYERYLRPIREAMAELGTVEELKEESGCLPGPDPTDPARVDGYTILGSLGKGAFGEVFQAIDLRRDQRVAVKFVELGSIYDMEKREDLLASARVELRAASRVRHPGVARVYTIGTAADGSTYIVQEFVRGPSLKELMEKSVVMDPLRMVRTIGLIASALEALHGEEVVHRDIKPENILMRAPRDLPVLVDFGISFVPGFEEGFSDKMIVGTLPYMAPEQLAGRPVDGKADIYALGVILHEWLTRTFPVNVEVKKRYLFRKIDYERFDREVDWRPLDTVLKDADPRVPKLVKRLLAADPSNRPAAGNVAAFASDCLPDEVDVYLDTTAREFPESTTGFLGQLLGD